MDDVWEKKYLKYKLKYVELKKLIGAAKYDKSIYGQEINSIIVTHNGRLRCLMDLLGIPKDKKNKFKFKNCAILKVTIKADGYSVKLVYSGELAADYTDDSSDIDESSLNLKVGGGKSDKYYVTEKKAVNEEIFTPFIKNNLSSINLKKEDLNNNTYTFYIIRHGDGLHNKAKDEGKKNLMSTINKTFLDAKLTDKGITQAVNAGKKLKDHLGDISIDYLFTSDLIRTRQTLESILNQGIVLTEPKANVKILPCSHELNYSSKGCDGNQGIGNIISAENSVSCKFNKNIVCNSNDLSYCSSIKFSQNNTEGRLCLDWTFYNLFYNNKQRQNMSLSTDRFNCRNISMLSMSLFIIQNPNCNDRKTMEGWIKTH